MNPRLHTPVCDLLGCHVPVVLAGMGGVARADLVVAVTESGGFGFLGMVRESPDLIRAEIERVRAATARDFGVNLIPAATKPDLFEAELEVVLDMKVPVVALFWDLPAELVKRLRQAGVLVVCQVGSVPEAETALEAGAQILIAQGVEAGGHVRGTTPRNELVRTVSAISRVPVLAAGGVVSGRDLLESLSLGAEGVVLGTALLATTESFAHDYHKQRIVAAGADDTVLTQVFHVSWPRGANVRVLQNPVTRGELGDPFTAERAVIGMEGERRIWLFSTDSPLRDMTGDFELMALYAGTGAGAIDSIVSAGRRVSAIVSEAEKLLSQVPTSRPIAAEPEMASPVCYAADSTDVYAGYASRAELLEFCILLLEAERAGARICARTAADTAESGIRDLMRSIQRDESACCAMLLKWIRHMGGEPSLRTGGFYEKCLAIADIRQRIAFINRGQDWVARKIREMLPRIRDNRMHADFAAMLVTHQANIAHADAELR